MYCNSHEPKCKLEIGFNSYDELKEFSCIMEMINSFSKRDFSFLCQQLQWMISDLLKFCPADGLNVSESTEPDDLPFC